MNYRTALGFAAAAGLLGALALGGARQTTAQSTWFPAPPQGGVLGFVVETFVPPMIAGTDSCPDGLSPTLSEAFLQGLPPEERDRLLLKDNAEEFARRWKALAVAPNGANMCSQPDQFDRPLMKTLEGNRGEGLDLDGGNSASTCKHEEFVSPQGETGIDNQEYRVMGCTRDWRGVDGQGGDQERGYRQFLASGEWTQVLLIRGIDSFERDDDVEVIYANTPDRPMVDSNGKFLRGATFTVSTKPPRRRNVLRGRIVNGVLTTEPADIALTQTWGQGGARDIRGNRTKWTFRSGRLRLVFQDDGTIAGLVGGYKPVFDVIASPSLGGLGAATSANMDCASRLKTAKHFADGMPDANGQCTAISTAMRIVAIPAYVNDAPAGQVAGR